MSEEKTLIGWWSPEAPLTPEQIKEDMALLVQITFPDGIHINRSEVYVNGRRWKWESVDVSTY